ncbi:glycoside hydrolase superfamily [Fimicolochytrium jonesii]|uniref:glycoside hydrolase superfamily n=1 Tax=Fimicolochytrium jonesii TaxID=1396493 RepID=UPI0022FEF874|nr:glycoside hydrolase superfamily [Fimicolochytrium jonesii]KAI8816268.1 glycoside hydrolase superfamily [Fimicolochytrium jonesii]
MADDMESSDLDLTRQETESAMPMSTDDVSTPEPKLLTTGTHVTSSLHQGHTPAHEITPALSFEDLTSLQDGTWPDDTDAMKDTPPPRSPTKTLLPVVLVASKYPEDIAAGLLEIARSCVHRNFVTEDNMADYGNVEQIAVQFCNDLNMADRSVIVRPSHKNHTQVPEGETFTITVTYKRKCEAFRALGRMLGTLFDLTNVEDLAMYLSWEEHAQFETFGVMFDCSRCAVLSMDAVLYFLRTCALLGMNTFQLYTEDTFTVPGEPFFGYLRGAYTSDDITFIDNYAYNFGIEVFPCIQTLGHLGQILQWPRFAGVRDTTEVILSGAEETYELLTRVIEAASKPLRSKRIHIGMDEAHGVGEGRYKQIFGDKDSAEVFLEHLKRLEGICRERGLMPMVWSDMLFTLGTDVQLTPQELIAAKNSSLQSYYETSELPKEMRHNMPAGLDLVYWDYYHTNVDAYSRKIQQHRDLGFEPWVAGGIWSWNRFYSALPFSLAASDACLKACKRSKVKNVFVTTWGDDGNECDILSALPGILYWSEHCYTAEPDVDWHMVRKNFAGVCGGNLDDWIYASRIDVPLDAMDKTRFPPNVSKWILWNDPFYNFLLPQYRDLNLDRIYSEIATRLRSVSSGDMLTMYPLNRRLKFPYLLADTLRHKSLLRTHLVAAYKSADPARALYAFAHGPLATLRTALDTLWRYHRDHVWLATYKPFGMEVLEMRYGALRTRLESLQERVLAFCQRGGEGEGGSGDGGMTPRGPPMGMQQRQQPQPGEGPVMREETLPELDVELREVYQGIGLEIVVDFARAYTPSRALGTG